MFQVLFFSWFLAKFFETILSIYFLFFYKITKIKIKSFEFPKSIKSIKNIILGTSDSWLTIRLYHCPSNPAYYIVDWRIFAEACLCTMCVYLVWNFSAIPTLNPTAHSNRFENYLPFGWVWLKFTSFHHGDWITSEVDCIGCLS